ncbi:MAG: phytase [Steroidobacter sp.]
MRNTLLVGLIVLALSGCNRDVASADAPAAKGAIPVIAAQLATQTTFRHSANDSAVWRNGTEPQKSLLLVSGGEGGLELHDLAGKRLARFETIEAGFVEVRQEVRIGEAPQDLAIASDQRLGAVRVYTLDATNYRLQEITAQPLEINDEITGLCTYESALTNKLYAYVATNQGQLEQWELFERDRKIDGRLVRRIAAGKGVAHCTVDDENGYVYFSEESVGVWRIAAEPEADAAREFVDLIEPRGALHEEVKGLALYRMDADTAFLIARDAGAGAFNVYSLHGGERASFKVGGAELDVGDAEGITVAASPLGPTFPRGVAIVADEEAGDYKLVSLGDIASKLGLAAKDPANPASPPKLAARTVQPLAETEPVASYGDAADDPAIWVDAKDPSRSVVIGTDKKLGLNVYDLTGKRLQTAADGRMNNVDLRDGFQLAGKSIVVVAATNRTTKSISVYRFDPANRQLSSIADGVLDSGLEDPYGLCMYRSARSGAFYVLANDGVDGKLRQWKLLDRNGRVGIEQVREITVGSQAEGCAADDELGHLYVAEEDVGLWKYSAEPDAGDARTSVDAVENGNLTDDVEGVSIYYGPNGRGYLIASNQGEDNYAVYRREGANEYLGKFHVVANEALGVDGASETDGLDVVSAPLGAQFPAGLLVVQDGRNLTPAARQNFKYVSWREVMESLQSH